MSNHTRPNQLELVAAALDRAARLVRFADLADAVPERRDHAVFSAQQLIEDASRSLTQLIKRRMASQRSPRAEAERGGA
jgi:hypothetical protein